MQPETSLTNLGAWVILVLNQMTKRKPKQRELPFKHWGGKRTGAGRKPNGRRAGESHRTRAPLASRFPVHVNVKLKEGLPSLRRATERDALIEAFRAGAERFGFRLVHYAILRNHLHFLVEARDRRALSRGMQGLLIRVARRLNRVWDRAGKVFADRYHDVILRTPQQVRNALVYVLQNAKKHGRTLSRTLGRTLDSFASGLWFDGWREHPRTPRSAPIRPTTDAKTWLLRAGWRRRGLLSLQDAPAGAPGH